MFEASKFGKVIGCSLHHFSDTSQTGYGQVSYLRLVDQKGMIHCGLIMTKSRVTPTKFVSIPRLELAAAALSVMFQWRSERNWQFILKSKYIWTNSQLSWVTLTTIWKDLKLLWPTEFSLSKKTEMLVSGYTSNQSFIRQMIHLVVYLHLTRRKSNTG